MALLQWTLIWKRNTIIPCGHFHRHIGLHASPQTFLSAILQSWCIQTIDQPAKPTELPMSWNMCLLSNHFSHQTKWLSSCMAQSTAIWGTSLHPSLTSTSLDSIPFFICLRMLYIMYSNHWPTNQSQTFPSPSVSHRDTCGALQMRWGRVFGAAGMGEMGVCPTLCSLCAHFAPEPAQFKGFCFCFKMDCCLASLTMRNILNFLNSMNTNTTIIIYFYIGILKNNLLLC